MPTIYGDPRSAKTQLLENLRSSVGEIGNAMLQRQIQEKQRKQELQDAIRKAVIQNVMGGKMKAPAGFDPYAEGQLDLGQFKPIAPSPTTSIIIAGIPFERKLKARSILGMSPERMAEDEKYKGYVTKEDTGWGKEGFMSRLGAAISPWATKKEEKLGALRPGGITMTPKEYKYTPEFEDIRSEAQKLLDKPYNITQRFSGIEDVELVKLINEYETTDDPVRIKELETLLAERGVSFE